MKFSENLQRLRKEKGLSQEALAEQLNVTRQSVSKWESGASYPEMDKLLALCQIFNCDLDSFVNKDASENQTKNENKETFKYLLEKLDIFMKKIIFFFTNMSFLDFLKFIIELGVLLFIIYLFHLPVQLLESLLWSFLKRYTFITFLGNILEFILELTYIGLAILIFLYVLKLKYLDRIEEETIVREITQEKIKENKEKVKIQKIYLERGKSFSDLLAFLLLYFIKFWVLLILIVGFSIFLCLLVLLGIIISWALEGLPFIGIIIGLLGVILLAFCILEPLINFIFNHKNNFKRLMVTLISSFILIVLGTTIFALDFMNITYINKEPPQFEKQEKVQDFDINNSLNICYISPKIIEYKINNNLTNQVRLHLSYYKPYDVEISVTSKGFLYINYLETPNKINFNGILNIIKENLKEHKLYQYDLEKMTIIIEANSSNLERIKETSCY